MAGQDSDQEKTQPATPKKLSEAREKGEIPRSRELTTMFLLLGSGMVFYVSGEFFFSALHTLLEKGFTIERNRIFDEYYIANAMMDGLFDGLLAIGPMMFALMVFAAMGPLAIGGWSFYPAASGFKWNRIDPISGMKRVFGARGLIEMFKALAKFALILGFAMIALYVDFDEVASLGTGAIQSDMVYGTNIVFRIFLITCCATMFIALIDVPYQTWEFGRKQRMSHQDIKDEMKQHEGSPETRARIRSAQTELANRRMMSEVPKADVIVTNPTHYAIALRFDAETMGAPIVVAKGADQVAFRIREIARESNVAIVSAPPLARAIFHTTKLNREIPAALYLAVAQVLAYVVGLKKSVVNLETRVFDDLPIPPEYQH